MSFCKKCRNLTFNNKCRVCDHENSFSSEERILKKKINHENDNVEVTVINEGEEKSAEIPEHDFDLGHFQDYRD